MPKLRVRTRLSINYDWCVYVEVRRWGIWNFFEEYAKKHLSLPDGLALNLPRDISTRHPSRDSAEREGCALMKSIREFIDSHPKQKTLRGSKISEKDCC